MALVAVDEAMIRDAATLTSGRVGLLRVGLYESDPTIDRHTLLPALHPATFGGYAGLRDATAWSTPAIEGDRAVTRAAPILWTYDGLGMTGYVTGYYVVDGDGTLLYVERNPAGPVAMIQAGQDYTVVPTLSVGTRYGGES